MQSKPIIPLETLSSIWSYYKSMLWRHHYTLPCGRRNCLSLRTKLRTSDQLSINAVRTKFIADRDPSLKTSGARATIGDVRLELMTFFRLALVGLRGPRGLGRVFGKRFVAQRYGYKVDRKCQQRHPIVYSSLPKPTITDPAERTADHGMATKAVMLLI